MQRLDPEIEYNEEEMRRTLQKENRLYKTALDHEVEELKEQAKQVGKIALVAGGALVGAYLLVKFLKKDAEEEQQGEKAMLAGPKNQIIIEKTEKENSFVRMLKEQLALLLVAFLKEKLSEITGVEKRKVQERENELTGKS